MDGFTITPRYYRRLSTMRRNNDPPLLLIAFLFVLVFILFVDIRYLLSGDYYYYKLDEFVAFFVDSVYRLPSCILVGLVS